MSGWTKEASFLDAFAIKKGDVICLCGAGGKTSLMYHLALEARDKGCRVLVTTTTRILVPPGDNYDRIDLSGMLFANLSDTPPGIYLGGRSSEDDKKIASCPIDVLRQAQDRFDLLLIEADGAACKQLKGWRENEPVIPEFTTKTIGVVDISTIDMVADDAHVHRLPLFLQLTGAQKGEPITLCHLQRLIEGRKGLFVNSRGERIVFFNKMESAHYLMMADELRKLLPGRQCIGGSVHRSEVFR